MNGGGFAEFRLGQPDIADKAMQMLDQRHHDFPQPRVGRLLHHRFSGNRDILLTFDDHGVLPRPRPHGDANTNQAMTKGTADSGSRRRDHASGRVERALRAGLRIHRLRQLRGRDFDADR